MYSGEVVFAQLMEFLPRHEFDRCVRRYHGDRRVREFSCRDQFLCMAFAALQVSLAGRTVLQWIKQHLRINAFYGDSPNAVKTQVWIAISVYVLVAIVKKELKLERSLYEILQILSVAIFEKTPICEPLTSQNYQNESPSCRNQLSLFDL